MEVIFGYVLIILGVILIIISILERIGILKKLQMLRLKTAGLWDALAAFIKKTPWEAAVGIALIYFGLKLIGII